MARGRGLGLRGRLFSVSFVGIAAVALAGYYRGTLMPKPTVPLAQRDQHAYWVDFKGPAGWTKTKSPVHLFYYTDPSSKAKLKGFLTHGLPGVDSEQPEEARLSAEFVVDSIKEGGHDAEHLSDFKEGEMPFQMLKRGNRDFYVLTAFATKGVTTLTIEVSQKGSSQDVDRHMDMLRDVLRSVRFIQQPLPSKNARIVQALDGPPPKELLKR